MAHLSSSFDWALHRWGAGCLSRRPAQMARGLTWSRFSRQAKEESRSKDQPQSTRVGIRPEWMHAGARIVHFCRSPPGTHQL